MWKIYVQKMLMKIYSILTQKPCVKILKKWGLKVGNNFNVQNHSSIDISHCWLISIGDNVTLAPYAQILAHDASTYNFLKYTKISDVKIGNNVFIGAGAIILPNVKIGNNVIIGAGTVVTHDVKDNCVIGGAPSHIICSLDEYLNKIKNIPNDLKYDEQFHYDKASEEQKNEMVKNLEGKVGLIK